MKRVYSGLFLSLLCAVAVYSFLRARSASLPKNIHVPAQALKGLRTSSYPFLSGDTFRAFCDHRIDETQCSFDVERLNAGDTIFVNGNYLAFFFEHIHPHISVPYILVTHNSDCSTPGEYAHYLDDAHLVMWFGHNGDLVGHPKFVHIPLGLANRYWKHGNIKVVNEVIDSARTSARPILLYLNQIDRTNKGVRAPLRAFFADKPFCHIASRKPFAEYLTDLTHAKFVLCPRGNGLDCHRQWEALLMGAIPVMFHSSLDPVFEGLPVVLIKDESEVTEDFLNKEYTRLRKQTYSLEQAFAGYWLHKIDEVRQEIRKKYGVVR